MADAKTTVPGWGQKPADADAPETDKTEDTVSREELRKVIAERDGYKKRLRQLQKERESLLTSGNQPLSPDPTDPAPAAGDSSRAREDLYRRQLAEKDRTINRLLVDNEIADVAARQGAYDPKAVVKLMRDFFAVNDGKVQFADDIEDSGLSRFDGNGQERSLSSVVSDFLVKNNYLLRPLGSQGSGSRSSPSPLPVNLHGMTPERFSRLTPAEKEAVRQMAGLPSRTRVW